jgi:hypothetical protein
VIHPRRHPVSLPRVLLGTVLLVGVLAGVITLSEHLRHPLPTEGVPLAELERHVSDPRDPLECPEPPPHEGEPDDDVVLAPVDPEPVSVGSSELVDCPAFYDGRVVRYRGEAVGALMVRGAQAWAQLNDDIYSHAGPLPTHDEFLGGNAGIGVLLPATVLPEIDTVGGPKTHGDIVEVVGTFHRIDPATREVAVIRATEATVVAAGGSVEAPLLVDRLVAALVLVPLAGGALALQWWARRRSWWRPTG